MCGVKISAENRVDIPKRTSLSERKSNKTVIKRRESSANRNIILKKPVKQNEQEIGASILKQVKQPGKVLRLRKSSAVAEPSENQLKPKYFGKRMRRSLVNSRVELSGEQQSKVKKVKVSSKMRPGLESGVNLRSSKRKARKQGNSLVLNLLDEKEENDSNLNVDSLWRKHFGCLPPKKQRTN